jgi:hypothetical protein
MHLDGVEKADRIKTPAETGVFLVPLQGYRWIPYLIFLIASVFAKHPPGQAERNQKRRFS